MIGGLFRGSLGNALHLRDEASKGASGRVIPLNKELRGALQMLRHERIPDGAEVVKLEDWAEACRKKGLANSTTDNADNRRRAEDQAFRRACQKLEKSSLVCMYDGLVWIPRTRVQTRLKDPARKPGKVAGANEE